MNKTGIASRVAASVVLLASVTSASETTVVRSHQPVRPLAGPSQRPPADGPSFYVDAAKGDDQNDGSQAQPWKTVQHAVDQLKGGDTLFLRGGTYFEHVSVSRSGTAQRPITIRSAPGELAVINGGLREFLESPQTAWEPCPDGVEGEYRSTRTYPELGMSRRGVNVMGNFGDSMIPLLGYRFLADLRDPSMAWDVTEKVGDAEGVYCGPGTFFSVPTGRLHVRLAHTDLRALGNDNYRGETDPRKLPLVIAGLKSGPVLTVRDCRHVTFQDLMVCGARTATVEVADCRAVEFDGMTVYGGYAAFAVRGTTGLRMYHTACRGLAAPWTFRGHLKYRSSEARIVSASGWSATGRENQDFEIAYSEFTDCVDGIFIGNVKNVHFHHNLLDNVSDDGLFLTATTAYDGTTHGGDHFIYQNRLSRCLTTFAFGVGHGRQKMTAGGPQTGSGVWIYRNVFDFRRPVHYHMPAPDDERIRSYGRVAGDHGSPAWEPMQIYHNTIVEAEPMRREYYLADLAGHVGGGSRRRLLNNIAVQVEGTPGRRLPPVVLPQRLAAADAEPSSQKETSDPLDSLLDDPLKKPKKRSTLLKDLDSKTLRELKKSSSRKPAAPLPVDLQADGNLHWGYRLQPDEETLFQTFRDSDEFASSKHLYPPGWTAHDVVADPKFQSFNPDWRQTVDLTLSSRSPAVDAGVPLPTDWPDPLREADGGKPDIGAVPQGTAPWRVGIRGRLTAFGQQASMAKAPELQPVEFPKRPAGSPPVERKPAALMQGYPARDGQFVRYAFVKHGVPFEVHNRTWLDTRDYGRYGLIVVVGDLVRSKMTPNTYSESDLKRVQAYLKNGGTLLLIRAGKQVFHSQLGRYALAQLIGASQRPADFQLQILNPEHRWLKHLDPKRKPGWLNARNAAPLGRSKGETLIGSADGKLATLLSVRVGNGRLIYLGWEISAFLPKGASTVEDERMFEEQIQLLENIVTDVSKNASGEN